MPTDPFQIETERLVLSPPTERDAPAMAAIFGDLRVMEWLDRDVPDTPEQILERAQRHARFFRELGYCFYLVRVKESGALAGDCGLIPIAAKGPEIEIGWRFAPAHWGKGYATEAARAALRDAYTRTDLDEILAVTREDNARSKRVMEKIGMRFRGVETHYDKPCDTYVIDRASWRALT